MDRVADNTLSASLMYVGYVHGQHHSTSLSADWVPTNLLQDWADGTESLAGGWQSSQRFSIGQAVA